MIHHDSMRFAGVLLAAITFLAPRPAAAQIANGGFETASDDPPALGQWLYVAGAARDNTNPRSGVFAANLNNTSEALNVNVQQQTAPGSITPGASYKLSFWAQADYGVSGIGQVQLAFLNAGGNILPGSPQFVNIPASASYTQYMHDFSAPLDASAVFLGFNAVTGAVVGASSHLQIDDVAFASAAGGFDVADFNHDTLVNAADLTTWRNAFNQTAAGDADGDGDSDGADVVVWQRHLGAGQASPAIAAVPEPSGMGAAAALLGFVAQGRRKRGSARQS